jgi:nifR3 family TIM-barrel protein
LSNRARRDTASAKPSPRASATMLPWFAPGSPVPLYLAPMAGFTDDAFRALCKQHGAGVLVTEFAQCEGLVRGGESAWRVLRIPGNQRPAGVQIFGAKPDFMALAATLVQERIRPDFIDLNFGCPACAVTDQNAGSSLLRFPALLQEIAVRVVQAIGSTTPVTAKIRIGWDRQSINAQEIVRRLEDAGVEAIAIHGRTRAQGYSGEADWGEIARAVASTRIPIIGNGDIDAPGTAIERLRESGVRALMVGRAALGNPWLFSALRAALDGRPIPPPPSQTERLSTMLDYAAALLAGASNASIRHLLPKLQAFTHGLPGSRVLRNRLSSCQNLADLRALVSCP